MEKERKNKRIELNGVAHVVALFWEYFKVEEDYELGNELFEGLEYEDIDELVLDLMKRPDDGIYEACLFMVMENGDIETPLGIRLNKKGKVVTIS